MSSYTEKEHCPHMHGFVWKKTYLTDDTYVPLVALAVIIFISAIPTILLNALVIFAVATRHRLQSNSNILLACLASTDLLTGLVVQPIHIAIEIKRILGVGPFCPVEKLFLVSLTMGNLASLSHLVLISVDRYIAIKHSLRYQDIVTKRRILIGVLIAWAFTMFATIQEIMLTVMNSETVIFLIFLSVWFIMTSASCMLLVAVIVYVNFYIFSETRRQKRRIQTEQLPQEEAKRMKKDKKAANTLGIIFATLIMTYLPTIFASVYILSNSSESSVANSNVAANAVNVIVIWYTLNVVLLGSLVNPIIYCWRSKKLRRVFLEILRLRKPRNRITISPAT